MLFLRWENYIVLKHVIMNAAVEFAYGAGLGTVYTEGTNTDSVLGPLERTNEAVKSE